MGAVLHAQDGLLEIGAGANLGAGVLVYGTTKIGEGACIGASSSIVRAVIAKGAIVPPCSLISGLEQGEIVTATPEIVVASAVERTVTDIQIEITTEAIAEQLLETDAQVNPTMTPIETDITTLVAANSTQAKAHAQSQINRFIKRLYPQN
jgi:carbonic anhydrase/acetyltransferase-like protein (isoleucine patch superfamily)